MKTGRHSPKEEEARLKAARDAIGPDVELMVDCNNAWQDVTQAMQYIRRFEQYEPYFIEEPFSPDDIDSHSKLARLNQLPIATDRKSDVSGKSLTVRVDIASRLIIKQK